MKNKRIPDHVKIEYLNRTTNLPLIKNIMVKKTAKLYGYTNRSISDLSRLCHERMTKGSRNKGRQRKRLIDKIFSWTNKPMLP